jgi:large conductance mechanosensitive channel
MQNTWGKQSPSEAPQCLAAQNMLFPITLLAIFQKPTSTLMLKEFKAFAMRGNVIDLAVGVIIGGAFGKIVGSLIEDVITPFILKPALDAAHLSDLQELTVFGTVKYGNFLAAIINFLIIAFVLFLVIKGINSMKKKEEAAPVAAPPADVVLLTEIRDLLKQRP